MLSDTRKLITNFKLYDLGYDFMGFPLKPPDECEDEYELSFHHTIIPTKLCDEKVPKKGYLGCNGVILVRETSHDYIHVIERYYPSMFYEITSELIDELIKGKIDDENIYQIHLLLKRFEEEYQGWLGMDNRPLIKEKYLDRRFNNRR